MCSRARSTTEELERTLRSLAHCVQSAAEGYLVTDHGIVPASSVVGAVGRGSDAGEFSDLLLKFGGAAMRFLQAQVLVDFQVHLDEQAAVELVRGNFVHG